MVIQTQQKMTKRVSKTTTRMKKSRLQEHMRCCRRSQTTANLRKAFGLTGTASNFSPGVLHRLQMSPVMVECDVCLTDDPTLVYPRCGHGLCHQCMGDGRIQVCPTCRENIDKSECVNLACIQLEIGAKLATELLAP